jgi:hypothetical protein
MPRWHVNSQEIINTSYFESPMQQWLSSRPRVWVLSDWSAGQDVLPALSISSFPGSTVLDCPPSTETLKPPQSPQSKALCPCSLRPFLKTETTSWWWW